MKQKNQYLLLGALILLAGIIWYFNRNAPVEQRGIVSTVQDVALLSVENPHLRTEQIVRARKTEYKPSGRNLFSAAPPPPPHSTLPVGSPGGGSASSTPVQPTGPPPVPPLPVKFFGYGTVPNGTAKRAFFTDGEEVYIVAEGEVLLNRFRILKIGNASLEYEELASGRRGTTLLEEQAASPSS